MPYLFYFILVNSTLLFPGYVLLKKLKLFKDNEVTLCFSFIVSILLFSSLAILYYVFGFNLVYLRIFSILVFLLTTYFFIKEKLYQDFTVFKLPIFIFLAFSAIALMYISLPFKQPYTFIPDPIPTVDRNYQVFNVKILNLAHTPANDNYIPFRQAQFFTNRLHISSEPFIKEWGVNFLQRTPLMGGVVAYYFDLTGEKVPKNYLWAYNSTEFNSVYQKFQIIATILNSLFIFGAYLLISKIFTKKIANFSLIFIFFNSFFLYNTFFSWPKLFVTFFILCTWYLLLYQRKILLISLLSALAYYAHDLASIYIVGIFAYLVLIRQFREAFIYILTTGLLISPWYIVSRLIYHQESLFLYYPFFLHGIPSNPHDAIKSFFQTSPVELIKIKISYLNYLFSPFSFLNVILTDFFKMVWLNTIYTFPGAMGLSIFPLSYLFILVNFKKYLHLIISFIIVPVLTSLILIGNPLDLGFGALHYLEPIVCLSIGFAVFYLLKLNKYLISALFLLFLIQYAIVFLFGFNFHYQEWLNPKGLAILFLIFLTYVTVLYKGFTFGSSNAKTKIF